MSGIEKVKNYLLSQDITKDKAKELNEDVLSEMWKHITDKAQKEEIDGCACIEEKDVYGWATEWLLNYNPSKKTKAVPDKKKVEIEDKKVSKVKQTDLFGWAD